MNTTHYRENLTVLRFVFLRLDHRLRFPWSTRFQWRFATFTTQNVGVLTVRDFFSRLSYVATFLFCNSWTFPDYLTERKQQKIVQNKSHTSRLPRFPEHAQEPCFLIWCGMPYLDGNPNGIPVLFSVLFSSIWSRSLSSFESLNLGLSCPGHRDFFL